MRAVSESAEFPRVLMIHQGGAGTEAAFFEKHWPDACTLRDSKRVIYRGFGLGRGSLWQLFGPRSVGCALKTRLRGHALGQVVGDAFQMPGLFLVSGGRVLWTHGYQHAGDNPDFATLAERLKSALEGPL